MKKPRDHHQGGWPGKISQCEPQLSWSVEPRKRALATSLIMKYTDKAKWWEAGLDETAESCGQHCDETEWQHLLVSNLLEIDRNRNKKRNN